MDERPFQPRDTALKVGFEVSLRNSQSESRTETESDKCHNGLSGQNRTESARSGVKTTLVSVFYMWSYWEDISLLQC